MSILDSLRYRNIFGGSNEEDFRTPPFNPTDMFYHRPNPLDEVSRGIPMNRFPSEVPKVEPPPPSFTDRFLQTLQNPPVQEKPSKWRRAGAGLAGALTGYVEGPSRGFAAGQEFLNRPYTEKLNSYYGDLKRAQVGMQVEDAKAKEARENEIEAKRLEFEGRRITNEEARTQQQNRVIDIDAKKSEVEIKKLLKDMETGDYVPITSDPKKIHILDRNTGKYTSIDTSNLDDKARIELEGKIRASIQTASDAAALKRAEIAAGARDEDSQLEKDRVKAAKFKQLMLNPDKYKKYLPILGPDANGVMLPDVRKVTPKNRAVWDELMKELGDIPQDLGTKPGTTPLNPDTTEYTWVMENGVMVRKPKGK